MLFRFGLHFIDVKRRNPDTAGPDDGHDFFTDENASMTTRRQPNHSDSNRENSLLVYPLSLLTRCCIANPVRTIVLAVAAALFCVYLTATQLTFKTSRLDLINQKSEFNKLWIDYIEDFGDEDDLVVVVEGNSQEEITPVLDELSEKIKIHSDLFRAVLHGVDTTPLMRKGLHFIEDEKSLEQVYEFAVQGSQIVSGHWEYLNAETFLGGLCQKLASSVSPKPPITAPDASSPPVSLATSPTASALDPTAVSPEPSSPATDVDPDSRTDHSGFLSSLSSADPKEAFRSLSAFCDSLADSLSLRPTYRVSPLPPIQGMGLLKPEYFIADQGRMGVVLLKIAESKEGSFTYGTRSIEKLREIIRDCRSRHPETAIGLTGLTVMENDEMRISQAGSAKATILSLVGVALMFIAAFGGFRHPLLAVAALVIGMGWTMGWIIWSVGHLNILSMSFGVILVGLGIDFGIHYVSRYLEFRHTGLDPRRAVLQTSETVGPGVVIGAVTTSAAFFMIGLSEFTGIAELGIISAGGILLCCASAVILIPPMIVWADEIRRHARRGNEGRFRGNFNREKRESHSDEMDDQPDCHGAERYPHQVNPRAWLAPILRHPAITVAVCVAITAYLATGLPNLWYDHNLLNMQPVNLESVKLEKKLLKKWDKGAWFALSIADTPEELLERKKEFEKDPTLRVDEIISRFPKPTPEKEALIRQTRATLANLPEQPGEIPIGSPVNLGPLLKQAQLLVENSGDLLSVEDRKGLQWKLESVRQSLRYLSAEQYAHQIGLFQQRLAGEFLGRLHLIQLTSSPEPPDLNDLPESLVSRYVGKKSGKYLMRIYSNHEIWDMDKLSDFIARVKKVDPNATGNPIQTYEASLQMERSYKMASLYAFLVILPILYLDFRSIRYILLAIFPMLVGIVWAFGAMGILGIPFNPANTIVIPLIFGIGIDDGVHIVHDFRTQRGRYRMTSSLACAVFLTTLSTIIGFGSLMIADHRGLQSLGRVLVIGIVSCTLVSLILLPSILTLATRHREKNRDGSTDSLLRRGDSEEEPDHFI